MIAITMIPFWTTIFCACIHVVLAVQMAKLGSGCADAGISCSQAAQDDNWSFNCTSKMGSFDYSCMSIDFETSFTSYTKAADKGVDLFSPNQNKVLAFWHCTFGPCPNYLNLTFGLPKNFKLPSVVCTNGVVAEECLVDGSKSLQSSQNAQRYQELFSENCDNGDTCPEGYGCINNVFCLPEGRYSTMQLFTVGVASTLNNALAMADCLADVEASIDDVAAALSSFSQGDYASVPQELVAGLNSFQSVVSVCAQSESEGFWSALMNIAEDVIEALCPECKVIIDAAELIIAGVNVIDEMNAMLTDCADGRGADAIIKCGEDFGYMLQAVASA